MIMPIFSDINLFNLPRKTYKWLNRSKTAYAQSKYKGYKISESYTPRLKYLDAVDKAYFN